MVSSWLIKLSILFSNAASFRRLVDRFTGGGSNSESSSDCGPLVVVAKDDDGGGGRVGGEGVGKDKLANCRRCM